jgi:hypothetical protein
VRNEIFLLSSGVILYLLSGFLSEKEKKITLIAPVLSGLWLAIYLFVVNFTFANFTKPKILTGYMSSAACFLLLALSLSFIFWKNKKETYFYLSFVLLFAIVMTKSLLAIGVACLIFAAYLFFIKEKYNKKVFFYVFPFIAVAFTLFYFLFKTSFFYDKLLVWKTALFVIKDNLLFGVGFNNYKTISLAYGVTENAGILYTDNIFLQVLAETGVFGFFLFITILIIFFYFIVKKLSKENKYIYAPILIAIISFLLYNFFNSSAFVSTNMLIFFFLLAFPITSYNFELRKKKINSYILVALFLPFAILLGKPLYAQQQYKKGLSFFIAQKYPVAKDYFIGAIGNDSLDSEYIMRLADVYFAMYQKNEKIAYLDFAIELSKHALNLNKHYGKYYYQLAWLYYFKGNSEQVSENIFKAVEMDPFNPLYLESYGNLL